eukprot:GHVU01143093.1.p1 GENE.GHVU01143093.1~~GHVU01143093.1.p1  ORF type:complete len:228 (+),score=28.29 GHVU01143093.1:936-1619(+)
MLGHPLTTERIYQLMFARFGDVLENPDLEDPSQARYVKFRSMYFVSPPQKPSFNQYAKRKYEMHHYSLRANTVGQYVPSDWWVRAEKCAGDIRHMVWLSKATGLVSGDETFLNFTPRDDRVVVPTGTSRAGTVDCFDAKKGLTLMLALECFGSEVMEPYLIAEGAPGGDIERTYAGIKGIKVVCTYSHWMDWIRMKDWLDYIRGILMKREHKNVSGWVPGAVPGAVS